MLMNKNITTIVLTWWPCAGKTTAISNIKHTFEDRWVSVLTVPEIATMFFNQVWLVIWDSGVNVKIFQKWLIEMQLNLEKIVRDIAESYKWKVLIILDRWLLDSKAYVDNPKVIDNILRANWTGESEVLSSRYDWVIHMVTAADWAEEYYTLENNQARTETPEQARDLDEKIQNAYLWASKLVVVKNQSTFENKIKEVENYVSKILWIPETIEKENKYLVEIKDLDELLKISRKVDISQTYIESNKDWVEERVRVRSIDWEWHTYFYAKKEQLKWWKDNERIETERIIDFKEYQSYKEKWFSEISKERYCFLHEWNYFELDIYKNNKNFWKNEALLELELIEDINIKDLKIPDFLEIKKDVTSDENYKNANMAKQIA